MLAPAGAEEIENLTIEIRTDPETLAKFLASASAGLFVDGSEIGRVLLKELGYLYPNVLIWRIRHPISVGQEVTADVRGEAITGHVCPEGVTITTGIQIRGAVDVDAQRRRQAKFN